MAVNVISATFTPAATSHTGGDCVGAAQRLITFANAGTTGFKVLNSSLTIASGTTTASAYTLHLYSITPPSAIADDAPWDLTSADRAYYLGPVAIAQPADLGGTAFAETQTHQKVIDLPAGSTGLWAYLVITTTTTLEAVAHTVKLSVETPAVR
jgi:hypothetical protein